MRTDSLQDLRPLSHPPSQSNSPDVSLSGWNGKWGLDFHYHQKGRSSKDINRAEFYKWHCLNSSPFSVHNRYFYLNYFQNKNKIHMLN